VVSESEQLSITEALYPAIPASHQHARESFLFGGEGNLKEWDPVKYPGAECGKTKITEKCDDKHNCDYPRKLIPWDCTRLLCPICSPRAITRASNKATDHIWSTLSELKKAAPHIGWNVSSVIISAPQKFWNLEFDDLKKVFRKSLKHLGTENVAAILHLWRFRNNTTGEESDSIPWKEYRTNPDNYQKILAPHFHCFVIGKMVKSPKYHQDSDGWIYKKKRNKRGTLTRKDVFQIAHYAFTHASISTTKKRRYVAYYGLFNSIGVIDKRVDYKEIICPKCKNQRVHRQDYHCWSSGVDTFGLEEPAVKPIVHRKWAFRGDWQRWIPNVVFKDLDQGLDFTGIDAPFKEVEYVGLD